MAAVITSVPGPLAALLPPVSVIFPRVTAPIPSALHAAASATPRRSSLAIVVEK
jgi:hypothetical protein